MINTKKVELLAPAGSASGIITAVSAGADAVYIGGKLFGARAFAENSDADELLHAIDFAHLHDKRVYLTVNTLLKERELRGALYEYLLPFYEGGIDAVIVQDFGVFLYVKEHFPDLPIHCSTQMTVTGKEGAAFMKSAGAKRIVTARELSCKELKEIHAFTDIEIETFVHGALCYSYSGQCLFSSLLGGRSGNRGRCAQVCRLPYIASNGEKYSVAGNYILSPKDMMTLKILPDIIESGVASLKVEGRMKRPEYTAGVISIYRKYIDAYYEHPNTYQVLQADIDKLFVLFNRDGFNEGYYHLRNGKDMMAFINEKNKSASVATDISNKKEKLYLALKDRYLDKKEKIDIQGTLSLFIGSKATLTLSCDALFVTAETKIVSAAQNAPLSSERIRKQIEKTGNTPFQFETLDIMKDDDIFIPLQELNELRREALQSLEREMLLKYRRKSYIEKDIYIKDSTDTMKENAASDCLRHKVSMSALVEKKEQFYAILKCNEIFRIYIGGAFLYQAIATGAISTYYKEAHSASKELFLALPHIVRNNELSSLFAAADDRELNSILQKGIASWFDGFLIRNLEELALLHRYELLQYAISDYSLYTMNAEAKKFLYQYGLMGDTVPYELNGKELSHRDNTDSEMVVYGYLPMMVSAQCITKNLDHCTKQDPCISIKDRYGKIFFSQSYCKPCYNVIYNSLPLSLSEEKEQVKSLKNRSLRLSFSIEDAELTYDIAQTMIGAFCHNKGSNLTIPITKGHFKRGVE